MNALTTISGGGFNGQPQTMSSREIADLTSKRHDNVMRDTRAMLAELHGESDLLKFEGIEKDGRNRDQTVYLLPKRETLILVSGYNLTLRARIIDRWAELEEQARAQMIALPQDYASALRALADESEKTQALVARIEEDAPKVAFADQVSTAPDAISLGQAAKVLGTGRNRLTARLRELGWLTRIGEPYQDKINAGLLDVKIGSWEHPEKGLQRSVTALVTGKGLAKLHNLIGTTH